MIKYIVKRVLFIIPVLLSVTLLMFGLSSISAGDAARVMAEKVYNHPTQKQIEEIRHENGLDLPLALQYANWLKKAVKGDFGKSLSTGNPAFYELKRHFPVTGKLALMSIILLLILSVPLGILSAVFKNSILDKIIEVFSFISVSMPNFWIGLMLLYLFGVKFKLISVIGGTHGDVPWIAAFAMDVGYFGILIRLIRTNLSEVLLSDFVKALKAKGLSSLNIILKHGMKNSMLPVMTRIVSMIIGVLCGSAVIESIFSLNGIGALALEAVISKDLPVLQCFIVILSAFVVVMNLLVDISYSVIDRRIELK
ncbi:peptide/nickel transport system permease protein [Acetitomaculum ruminis DSM 5522]|uniref:Peptide/nickel transport system permease protein n=1 Tax=Acetitomaculum ruminis DSM 5522 TaxID=1120918 RepID=A0A1I0WMQ5_9FIRM|nr:ABC transporter permease [Acetitomaculum ruminis]SFA90029.1 peptide/nickel transport system permease protein [Acetitomaculum ruminis DSM 5522]